MPFLSDCRQRAAGGDRRTRRGVSSRWRSVITTTTTTLLLLLTVSSVVTASNPYSSNVVALTAANWKEVVVDTPHAVLVNICRSGWGYCQRLQSYVFFFFLSFFGVEQPTLCSSLGSSIFHPVFLRYPSFLFLCSSIQWPIHTAGLFNSDWEKLASSTKGIVTIAYWDTEGGSRPPRLLGEYQGTPTIRLFKPKKKQRNPKTHSEKLVLDYQHGERNVRNSTRLWCVTLFRLLS